MAASFFCARHNQGPAPWESHRKGINSSVRQVQAGFEVGLVCVRSRHCGMFLMWFSFDMLLGCVWCQVALYIYIYKKTSHRHQEHHKHKVKSSEDKGLCLLSTQEKMYSCCDHTLTHTHTQRRSRRTGCILLETKTFCLAVWVHALVRAPSSGH